MVKCVVLKSPFPVLNFKVVVTGETPTFSGTTTVRGIFSISPAFTNREEGVSISQVRSLKCVTMLKLVSTELSISTVTCTFCPMSL